jgi:amidase
VLDRNPCGSSSGSAVAVSANLATVAVGTETDGSVTCPSGATGIVGVKPSLGLVSRGGVVPITARQDSPGPMARNVTDAAILLATMAGPDRRDPHSVEAGHHALDEYTRFLRPQALQGKRIGVWRDVLGPRTPETDAAFEEGVRQLRRLGASTVDVSIPYIDVVDANEFAAIKVEFKHDINTYLAAQPGPHPADLAGLIRFDLDHAAAEMPYFAQELFDRAQVTSGASPIRRTASCATPPPARRSAAWTRRSAGTTSTRSWRPPTTPPGRRSSGPAPATAACSSRRRARRRCPGTRT